MTSSSPAPSDAIAAFVADTRFHDLTPDTVAAARRALLDAIGVSLAATRLGEGCAAFSELVQAQGGKAESTVMGSNGRRVPAAAAAFANGALAHAVDFEDAHDGALVHPNAATVPAALAAAEQTDADLGRTLTAIVVGCEVVCRMGLALRAPLDDFGWYPPPILGAFGATAAAASLYRLDAGQVRDALSLTLCQATCSAEIKHSPHSLIRSVRDAFAAKAGVLSAELAARGVTGFDRPLEGEAGFFAGYARGHYDPTVLTDGLGERFEIGQLSFKPWPSCRGTHVYIEAALALAREHDLRPEGVVAVHTTGSRLNRMLAEPAASKRRPATAIDARFSIPFTVATAMVHGDVSLTHFDDAGRRNPDVLTLAERVHYHVDDDAESMTAGTTEIRSRDGRTFQRHLTTPLGAPARPLSDAMLEEKFRHCAAAAGVPEQTAGSLVDTVSSSTPDTDIHQLTALL